jgi:hypothetical protein
MGTLGCADIYGAAKKVSRRFPVTVVWQIQGTQKLLLSRVAKSII